MVIIRKSVFDKLEEVKQLIHQIDPEIENISVLLGKIGTHHYNKKKGMLLGKHKEIYNILRENSINPYTAYKWSLLERVPEEIKYQLQHRLLGQKKAKKFATKQKRCTDSALQIDIKQRGMMLIRGL